jgi:hypothetical protein
MLTGWASASGAEAIQPSAAAATTSSASFGRVFGGIRITAISLGCTADADRRQATRPVHEGARG